ncbi:F-box only protein 13 [Dichanthelium oligosanthes]|uniref:F-box only protein 13 n=1 Tax=Dichanthelium oligosanthes TaxID=888268 RepID=A0A1E5WN70_9POAL|nr:F-box only protein 13 [Dichanthelium oligosanthes]
MLRAHPQPPSPWQACRCLLDRRLTCRCSSAVFLSVDRQCSNTGLLFSTVRTVVLYLGQVYIRPAPYPYVHYTGQPARPAVVFDPAEHAWARWRGAPGPVPVAAAGGIVLYRDPATAELTVVNPLTGASRALPPPPPSSAAGALQAIAMYGSPYRVVLILGELPDLSMASFDSTKNAWEGPVPLSRKAEDDEASSRERVADEGEGGGGDDTVYFLSKSGDVVATTMQRSASRQYSSAVACAGNEEEAVAYFLSRSGTVVACDLARRAFAELPRILPAYHEYSIDVVACGGAAYAVVLSEFLDTASMRVWEHAGGAWRQVAAMPPAMSHAFRGAKVDVNCVGHGDRIMVCVSSGDAAGARGCFMCDVRTNRWEELPRRAGGDGEDAATGYVAALSFEPRMEAAV